MTTLGLVVEETMNRETETDLMVVRRDRWREGCGGRVSWWRGGGCGRCNRRVGFFRVTRRGFGRGGGFGGVVRNWRGDALSGEGKLGGGGIGCRWRGGGCICGWGKGTM